VGFSSEEALWVLRAQCDDREALELLLRHIQPSLRRYLTGVVGPSDIDDVLQDVLLIIYRKLRWLHAGALFNEPDLPSLPRCPDASFSGGHVSR
jgi:hypothetical protein